jgi:outer membrane protein TolC
MAETNRNPDWSVQVMYSQRGPAFSNMISINVSVPLQWDRANRQERELAAKLATLEQARAEREDRLRAHTAEVRAMLAEWKSDRERIGRYERELVPLASERTQATLASYRGAKAALSEVLSAHRGEIEVRMQALQLEADTARLWAQLNYLVLEDGHEPTSRKEAP